jgi:hypothetical protein
MADLLTPNRPAKASYSKGLQRIFAPDRLTLGVFFPIEAFFEQRAAFFRDNLRVVRAALSEQFSTHRKGDPAAAGGIPDRATPGAGAAASGRPKRFSSRPKRFSILINLNARPGIGRRWQVSCSGGTGADE